MKKFFVSVFVVLTTFLTISAQQNSLKPNLLIQEAKKSQKSLPVELFKISKTRNDVNIPKEIESYSILDIDREGLKKFRKEKSNFISLTIPQEGRSDLTLELVEVQPFAEGFTVKTAPSMQIVEVNTGKHYRGIIKGQERSIAAISIFDDQIMGFISHPSATGNLVIGKLENSPEHILYQDDQISEKFNFDCQAKDKETEYTTDQLNGTNTGSRALSDCVRLYLEVDYDIYVNKGSTTTAVTNYVTGIFNQVSTLYANEQINTVVSEIVVWTQQSPYNSTSSINMLNAFTANRQRFNGDLAQLLSFKASGGVAYVDGLCRSNPDYSMGYAGIQSSYSNVPTYSWTVEVCAHEFGHLFGSQHTHACVWNGNNTAIDGCYTTEGGCANPGNPPATVGGTIMSYCHLTSSGINFSNGFGVQPGNVIRSEVTTATCLQACSGGGGGGNQCTENVLSLEIRTDNYPTETTWNIKNSAGAILYSGGPYNTPNTLNTISLCLPSACYTFNIIDGYGDGICCAYGSGYYNIKQGTATLITGGQFGATETKSFCASGTSSNLTLSTSAASVSSAAGNATVGVTSNISWTASSNATTWCTVTPASGSNNGNLTVSYLSLIHIYGKSYKKLDNNIGYVTLQTIKEEDISRIKSEFIDTKGIIIDIRNYPSTFVPFSLGSFFVSSSTPFVKFTNGNVDNPGEFTFTNSIEIPSQGKTYKGKLVVLVNELSQSQAEYTSMAFRAGDNTTIIGSTTAGADGNVSAIMLPGGLRTMISGIGVNYPNGEETQRIGIVPDIEVKPTIKGIREGKDELLEKAIEIILKQ